MSQIAQSNPSDVFGQVTPPAGVQKYDALAQASGDAQSIGLLIFLSYAVRVATIIAGIYVFINFILAGYEYITSNGDTGAHNKVKDRLTMSIIGLVIIGVSYMIVALLSLIITGEAGFFLNPTIPSPVTP